MKRTTSTAICYLAITFAVLLVLANCEEQTSEKKKEIKTIQRLELSDVIELFKKHELRDNKFQKLDYACQTHDYALDCFVSVNETFEGHHFEFNATFDASVDMKEKSVSVALGYDGSVIFKKTVKLQDLTLPICVPVLKELLIDLCLEFSNIKFSTEKNCFSATAALTLKLFKIKKITLIPPQPFGYNREKCENFTRAVPLTALQ